MMNHDPTAQSPHASGVSTNVWGTLEQRRFLKLPKTFAFLGRYDPRVGFDIQPRHLLLIIALACRKFGDIPIRATWQDIASGLGVRRDTLRRWAYELRDLGLLRIQSRTGDDNINEANEFDISPFVELLADADAQWREKQAERQALGDGS